MTGAEMTARRVLRWAMNPDRPVPSGPLRPVATLLKPDDRTHAELGGLAAATAARLGAGSPPLGDPAPITAGALLLAAAVGGAGHPEQARVFVAGAEPIRLTSGRRGTWSEAVARHAVVGPVVARQAKAAAVRSRSLDELSEALLLASPLTAILYRPERSRLAGGLTELEFRDAVALLGRPRGRRVLCTALAGWSPDPAVLTWRATLLGRLRANHPGVVVETYLNARVRHAATWDEQLRSARRLLSRVTETDPSALATVRYWAPLEAMLRRPDTAKLVRAHPLLTGFEGEDGATDLVRRHRLGD